MHLCSQLVLGLAIAVASSSAKAPRGIDYLGAGYDVLFGNPDGSEKANGVADPGFRRHIVKFNWTDGNSCSGLTVDCPAEAYIYPETTCQYQSTSSEISSTKSFQSELAKDASIEGSVSGSYGGFKAKASFSASRGMREMKNKVENEQTSSFECKAICVKYQATLFRGITKPDVSVEDNFKRDIDELPSRYTRCYTGPRPQCPSRGTAGDEASLPPLRRSQRKSRRLLQTTAEGKKKKRKSKKKRKKKSKKRRKKDMKAQQIRIAESLNKAVAAGRQKAKKVAKRKIIKIKTSKTCSCASSVLKYFKFIQQYGTHYTTQVEMGGKMIRRVEIKSSDVKTMKSKGVDVAFGAAVKAGYSGFGAKVSASVKAQQSSSKSRKSASAVAKSSQKVVELNIGGMPNEDWRAWASTTGQNPMPVRYKLAPIVELVKGHDRKKAFLLTRAIQDYVAAYAQWPTRYSSLGGVSVVKSIKLAYTIQVPSLKNTVISKMAAVFRVSIGNKGDMKPLLWITPYATRSIRCSRSIRVPTQYNYPIPNFKGQVPVYIQFVGWKIKTTTKKKVNPLLTPVATAKALRSPAKLKTARISGVLSNSRRVSLDNTYYNKQLRLKKSWGLNPMD